MPVRMRMALQTPAQRILNLFFQGYMEASTGDFVSLPDAYRLFTVHFLPRMLNTTELAEAKRELDSERAFDNEFSQLFILERIRFVDHHTGLPVLHYGGIRALPIKSRPVATTKKRPQLLIDDAYERAEQAECDAGLESGIEARPAKRTLPVERRFWFAAIEALC